MGTVQKKPPVLGKLHGAPLERTDVTINGIVPGAVWVGNPAIEQWGLCWRVMPSKQIEITCSIMLKRNMMPGHGCVLAIDEAIDNPVNVDLLIRLAPVGNPKGEPDYVAVSLPWDKCTEDACGEMAKSMGMTFDGTCPDELEDFISSWTMLDAARLV